MVCEIAGEGEASLNWRFAFVARLLSIIFCGGSALDRSVEQEPFSFDDRRHSPAQLPAVAGLLLQNRPC